MGDKTEEITGDIIGDKRRDIMGDITGELKSQLLIRSNSNPACNFVFIFCNFDFKNASPLGFVIDKCGKIELKPGKIKLNPAKNQNAPG